MKRSALLFAILLCCSSAAKSATLKRPRILGIAQVEIYVSNLASAKAFYSRIARPATTCVWCEEIPRSPFIVPLSEKQTIFLLTSPSPSPSNLLAEITFWTNDIKALKQVLAANNITFSDGGKSLDNRISLIDPAGNRLAFEQFRATSPMKEASSTYGAEISGLQLIHAGFIVRDRAATEHFYKDILGFRPYWHGGMKDDQTDWVSMQVPDGTDWLEFMVNVEPDADQRLRGIMNHIAIGVPDIHATQKKLIENGVNLTEELKIGRDGKWQLNLYDPDDTRIEFMEFTPVQKPCCSEFTGPHPKP